ncbi:MAG TPA: hypothetical protein VKR58_12365, partial [Aquella sp.]|nr:hypothetical protein [Aquella sp.]
MNKLFVMIFLVSPVIAMETLQLEKITGEDSESFWRHFSMAFSAFDRKIQNKTYPEDHAIGNSLFKLRDALLPLGNIKQLLQDDHDLRDRVNNY